MHEIDNQNDSSHVTDVTCTSRIASAAKKHLNTENNWALYIGLSWYPIIVLSSWWGITPGHLYRWQNGDIIQTFTPDNVMSFLLIMSFTIICFWVVHDSLGVQMNM